MDYLLEFYQSPLTKTKFVCSTNSREEIKNVTKADLMCPKKKLIHISIRTKYKKVSQHTKQSICSTLVKECRAWLPRLPRLFKT